MRIKKAHEIPFLLRKLMVLLALEQMVLICLPHLRFDEMVHPRYFVDV
jgi:hypothetical protein